MKKSFENKILMMPERQKAQLRKAVSAIIESAPEALDEESELQSENAELEVAELDVVEPTGELEVRESDERNVSMIALSQIVPSPYQTRRIGNEAELEELANSIKAKGILSPLLVRIKTSAEGAKSFELVAGERRFRAAKLAGLKEVPAFIENYSDRESLEIAIIENAQREDLNPIEQARAFKMLNEQFDLNQTEVAETIGKSRVLVANSLRLLQLEPEILAQIESGELSGGHGKALLGLDAGKLRVRVAKAAIQRALSVRALEDLVRRLAERSKKRAKRPDLSAIAAAQRVEKQLSEFLQLDKVKLKVEKDGSRHLSLAFPNESAWRKFMAKVRS